MEIRKELDFLDQAYSVKDILPELLYEYERDTLLSRFLDVQRDKRVSFLSPLKATWSRGFSLANLSIVKKILCPCFLEKGSLTGQVKSNYVKALITAAQF